MRRATLSELNITGTVLPQTVGVVLNLKSHHSVTLPSILPLCSRDFQNILPAKGLKVKVLKILPTYSKYITVSTDIVISHRRNLTI